MTLCACATPVRSLARRDRLRCYRCGGWTAYGRPHNAERAQLAAGQITSLAARTSTDLAWLASVVHQPTRRSAPGRATTTADPVLGAVITNEARPVSAYATIAARAVERALAWLHVADTAAGHALLAAEPAGLADHIPAPYHDPAVLYPGRPDLVEAHAAKERRAQRREGWGSG